MFRFFRLLVKLRFLFRFRTLRVFDCLHWTVSIRGRSLIEFPAVLCRGVDFRASRIGSYSYVAVGTRIMRSSIGRYCSIGPECLIGGLGRHPVEHYSTSPLTFSASNVFSRKMGGTGEVLEFEERGEVVIGNDVWIGARVIILDGVKIGDGAVIGANTVVAKDVPPYAIFVGASPTVRRYRLDEGRCVALRESEWWNKTPDEIRRQPPI